MRGNIVQKILEIHKRIFNARGMENITTRRPGL